MAYAIHAEKIGGPEVLYRKDFEPTAPPAGSVLVRHTAIGVNFIDVYYRTGLYAWPQERDLVLGSEAAGVVEAVGSGVSDFQQGDRVAYTIRNGAYATHRSLAAQHLVKVPDGIPDAVAAGAFLKGLTVHYLLHHSFAVEPGQSILFHAAAGGVGLIAGQWLAAKGVASIGTAGGKEKCSTAAGHGYDHVIDYKADDFVTRVLEITDGRGVDAVYDSVGRDTYPGSLRCLRRFGALVNFGQSSGPALDFKLSDLAVGSFSVTRPILFHYTSNPKWLRSAAADLFDMIESGKLRIPVNQTFPLERAGEAQRLIEGRKTTGSTVLTV